MLPAPGEVSPVHLTDSVSKPFLRQGCRYDLYPADQATVVQLIEEADDTLFNNTRHNPLHIRHPFYPNK